LNIYFSWVPPFLSSIISENTTGGSLSWYYHLEPNRETAYKRRKANVID